jgi:hypothetical protein
VFEALQERLGISAGALEQRAMDLAAEAARQQAAQAQQQREPEWQDKQE